MKQKYLTLIVILFVIQAFTLALLLPLAARAMPAREEESIAAAGVPPLMSYQGYLTDAAGNPLNANVNLQFTISNQAGTPVWNSPASSADVRDGYFTAALSPGVTVFDQADRWLQVRVNGTPMPRQQMGAAPYAFQASTVNLQNVVIVAKSGGDYNTIQAAINSISDAAANNPYLVWVAPGIYTEAITMQPYISLQGSGPDITVISSDASNNSSSIDNVTLKLAGNVSLRDLSVWNSGTGAYNAAVMGKAGTTHTAGVYLENVSVHTKGTGSGSNYGIYLIDTTTSVELFGVNATAENAAENNWGLSSDAGAKVELIQGNYVGSGGSTSAFGISNQGAGTSLIARDVTATGMACTSNNTGFSNDDNAYAELYSGKFVGRGGAHSRGIRNGPNVTATLSVYQVYATGIEASSSNIGLLGRFNSYTYASGSVFVGNGTNGAAIQTDNGGSMVVRLSVLWGSTFAINNATTPPGAITVTHSQLYGGAAVGAATCVASSFDNNFTAGPACPAP
ncbi:MAG: pectinesterase family protein [Chloroflexota bacterium]